MQIPSVIIEIPLRNTDSIILILLSVRIMKLTAFFSYCHRPTNNWLLIGQGEVMCYLSSSPKLKKRRHRSERHSVASRNSLPFYLQPRTLQLNTARHSQPYNNALSATSTPASSTLPAGVDTNPKHVSQLSVYEVSVIVDLDVVIILVFCYFQSFLAHFWALHQ